MINFVNFELIVTFHREQRSSRAPVRNPSVNWPVCRLMMQPCAMFVFQISKFQFNVKLRQDKEKQMCWRERERVI